MAIDVRRWCFCVRNLFALYFEYYNATISGLSLSLGGIKPGLESELLSPTFFGGQTYIHTWICGVGLNLQ